MIYTIKEAHTALAAAKKQEDKLTKDIKEKQKQLDAVEAYNEEKNSIEITQTEYEKWEKNLAMVRKVTPASKQG